MALLEGWDAAGAIARCPIGAWRGEAWRAHAPVYHATDAGGARRKSGRYHRARDLFPAGPVWAVLYLALSRDVCLGEILRNVTALPVRSYRITRLRLELQAVVDCRDVTKLGLSLEDLVGNVDYETPQQLAAAAFAAGVEGMLVPSATLLGDNLIVFVDRLRPGSRIEVVDYVEPNLTKPPHRPIEPPGTRVRHRSGRPSFGSRGRGEYVVDGSSSCARGVVRSHLLGRGASPGT